MPGVLLDSHSLLWLSNSLAVSHAAELAVARAQARNALYVSPITAWEIGVASGKKNHSLRPHLRGFTPDVWFELAIQNFQARLAQFTTAVALEAALVPATYGSGDHGDCFLIATAHVQKFTLITRDKRILSFAKTNPNYLSVISC
jgi:PIN domain nuclease of toxin-antitoxin system